MSVRIKICGITRREDVDCLIALGVEAMGLNFYPGSPRYLTPAEAAPLAARAAGRLERIGVFVDADLEVVREVLATVELDALQFHGDEDDAYCRAFAMPYIKVQRVGGTAGATRLSAARLQAQYPGASAFLLDTLARGVAGGTGRTFDWSLWPVDAVGVPIYLAGGLDAGNVAEAIAATAPFGVDAAGGVEARAGVKDPVKLQRFVEEVRRAGAR